MSLRLSNAKADKVRAITAALLFSTIAFALGISVSPQLHQWLHDLRDQPNHECAATLLSSGSAELSACEPVLKQPQPAPPVPAFRAQPFARVLAVFGFSLLEHAPPAQS